MSEIKNQQMVPPMKLSGLEPVNIDSDSLFVNIGLAGNQVQKPDHRCLAVQHGLVHVDVYDLCAVFNLLAGYGQSRIELAIQNHACKS